MTKAFESYEAIMNYPEGDRLRAWLLDYEGLHFSIGMNGADLIKWKEEEGKYVYSNNLWQSWFEEVSILENEKWTKRYVYAKNINKIQRHKRRLVIEFDNEEKSKIPAYIEAVKKKLKDINAGFIVSTHKGKSDYIWVEFTRELTSEEAKTFLIWIAPEGSEIDLNFCSDNKRFPILFAEHWKYRTIEEPIEYFLGDQIDYDNLGIKRAKGKKKNIRGYQTFKNENIEFDYDTIKPKKEITNLADLKEIIMQHFPSIWFEVKACLSVFASMSLNCLNGCPSLTLVGSPSGEKTTALSFFYGHNHSYLSDDFTPRAFVSHSVNVKEKELEKIDLLPKIRNKVLISPELAPLFEAPKDKLLDNFSILTRVLDGEGLNRDTGTHGHRGYSGDYKFGWLGATTPLKASVWSVMGKIGNRLFFLNMSEKNRSDEDYLQMFSEQEYQEKVKICRGAILNFLDNHFKKYPIRSLEWNNKKDTLLLPEIIRYAKLLSKCRATLMTWKSEKGEYEYNFPIIEEPPRAINCLYIFSKGHALINDRTFLKSEDIEIPRRVCFSSMPHDRFELLKLLIKHEGRLSTEAIQKELMCSDETARRTMKIFEILGVVEVKNLPVGYGRPMNFIEIKPEFKELLQATQDRNNVENNKPQENGGVFDIPNPKLN